MTDRKKKKSSPSKPRSDRRRNEVSDTVFDALEKDEVGGVSAVAPKAKGKSSISRNKKSSVGHMKLTLAVFTCIMVLIVSAMAVAGFIIVRKPYNYPNVYIGSVPVGKLTKEQTIQALAGSQWEQQGSQPLKVELPANVSFEIDYIQAGMKNTKEQAAEAAYAYGRSNELFSALISYLRCCVFPSDADSLEKTPNEQYIREAIDRAAEELDRASSGFAYKIDNDKQLLMLTKGAGEIKLNKEGLYNSIVSALLSSSHKLEYKDLAEEIKDPDFKKLYDKIALEAADAYYTDDFDVVDEVIGRSFDIELAKKIWDAVEVGEEIKIPMQFTTPEITGDKLREVLFADKLGSQTTSFKWSTENRIGNINLVAQKLNEHILLPGDTFSFNEFVGQRTEEAGFRTASAYNDGQVVDAIGGGICQVSSTLYCASMYAGLKTVSRTNHYFKVDYLDRGYDATVSWTKPDFKFQNNRSFPVMLVAYCDNDECSLTIEIWGTNVDGSYITLRTVTSEIYDKEYTDTLIGYSVICYRSVFDADGNFLYDKAEPGGAYYLHEEEIQWPKEKDEDYLAALREIESNQNMTEDEYLDALEDLYAG